MNFRLIALVAVAALSLQLCATLVDKLPAPEYVDTEVSAHYPLQQPENVDNLDFSLVFNATASNNVEVAFGADADGDGKLALDETEMIIGWDCGRYFIENFKAGEIVEEAAADIGARRSLNWHYRIYGNRATLKSFAATNETGVVFAELSVAKPQWLYSCNWNMMRLTARGIDAQNEAFDVDISRKGIVIILR